MHEFQNSVSAIASASGSEILLAAASANIYRINAFRISGLHIDATTREISNQVEKIDKLKKYGGKNSNNSFDLTSAAADDFLREAMQRLRDPERRIIDEFFWFWPHKLGQSKKDEALKALANNNLEKARDFWVVQEATSSEANVSMHNLAVLSHLRALDFEYKAQSTKLSERDIKIRDYDWRETFKRWKILLEYEGFWSRFNARIRELDDPRLTTGTARRIRESLPLALLSINACLAVQAAETDNISEAKRHLQIINESGFDHAVISEALRRSVEPLRKRIKTLCKSASAGEIKPENALDIAQQLVKQTAPLLSILGILLPTENPTREGAQDEVALTTLSNIVSYANKTEKWQDSDELLHKAFGMAISQSAKTRIQKNIDIFKANVEYDLEYKTCFFCKANPSEDVANLKVSMHGNIERYYNRITWNYVDVTVPRCAGCKKAHERLENYLTFGGVAGTLLGLGSCIAIASYNDEVLIGGIVMGISIIFIGVGIGNFIAKKNTPAGIKPLSDKNNFSRIKELLKSGWSFGQRPAQAN